MPIYEFFCESCDTIFSFFSPGVNTEKTPPCPRCGAMLARRMSLFSVANKKADDADDAPGFDPDRMEQAVGSLAAAAENLDESDSRGSAEMFRRFSEKAGVRLSAPFEEALSRIEAGEDPKSVEAEMEGALENEPFLPAGKKSAAPETPLKRGPSRDETLYEL